jgi:hypothetical protein
MSHKKAKLLRKLQNDLPIQPAKRMHKDAADLKEGDACPCCGEILYEQIIPRTFDELIESIWVRGSPG